ncbi:acyl-CoA dehydrogenase family protein [Microbacterium saperdae]|uniref:Glutaryl-CoA dehydrogenase n=1 Tax=Microbacterium saperdae TaxID=69368 RepID=A0A543BLA9_9MICO|nr:acyl-CoA dehydrogenase family protein [Microbacterium saperdae]TQL85606.1 glutaryl-CoA dehydrogenase [Microbacterium saperdae]GGM62334.1 acyl-CoA dehydrogenase [Microbacterium saperdae]
MNHLAADRYRSYYLLDDTLGAQERDVASRVRAFVDRDLLPVINEYWERAEFPHQLVPLLADLDVAGGAIEGYGCPRLTRLGVGIVARELSRGDGSMNTFLAVHSGLTMGSISMLGDEEQKSRWLPDMARLRKIGAFALTEPEHGSDSVALETSARREGDFYILNGRKRWIGNASFADIVVIWARDEDDGHVKGFVLEKHDDGTFPSGYETTVITGKIGKRAVLQPDVVLKDLRIPVGNRLAHAETFRDVSRVLATTRSGAAWEALGHATAAYEIALAYAGERSQFGRPIASFQLVQHRLANMLSELTAMELICFRLADLSGRGQMTSAMASLAKMHTAQKGRWICSTARDILGGNGLLLENHVARHLTDMEVVHTYEGTDSIQALIVGRDITGVSAFA